MSDVTELFSELMYGGGAWIAVILILSIMVLGAWRNRVLCIFMIPVSLMLSVAYFHNVTPDNDLMWAGVLFLVLPMFLALRAVTAKED